MSFAIRTSAFQTWLAQRVAAYYSGELNTEITIDKVDVLFFDRVEIKGIYIEDQRQDTLVFANSIIVNIGDWNINESFFYLDNIALETARVNLKTYKGDSTMNFQFIADYFASDDTTSSEFDFRVHQLELANVNFSLQNENDTLGGNAMNYSDLYLRNLGGKIYNYYAEGESIFVSIKGLSTTDRSGFQLVDLSGDIEVSPKKIALENLNIETPETHLKGKFGFLMDSFDDFSDFTNKVKFDVVLKNSKVQLSDVAYFVPQLYGADEVIDIEGLVSGPVNNMYINELDIAAKTFTHFHGSMHLPNFSDFENSPLSLRIDTLETNVHELKTFKIPPFGKDDYLEIPSDLMALNTVQLNANIEGLVSDMDIRLFLKSGIGSLQSQIDLHYDDDIEDYHYVGNVTTNGLAINKLMVNDDFGIVSANINLDGKYFDPEKMDLRFEGSEVEKFDYLGYEYRNIRLYEGRFHNSQFKGNLKIDDKNLQLDFVGLMDFRTKVPKFNIELDLYKAKLAILNLLDKDTSVNVVTSIKANIDGTTLDDINGSIVIDSLFFTENNTIYDLGKIEVSRSETLDSILLSSKFIDGKVIGEIHPMEVANNIISKVKRAASNAFDEGEITIEDQTDNFSFNFNIKTVELPLEYFDIPLTIAPNTEFSGFFDSNSDAFSMTATSDAINYDGMKINDLKIRVGESFGSVKSSIRASNFMLNDSLSFNHPFIKAEINKNLFNTIVKWESGPQLKDGNIGFEGDIEGPQSVNIFTTPSHFYINDDKWEINPNASILIDSSEIEVKKFFAYHLFKEISLNGKTGNDPSDKLNFGIYGFQLEDFNGLLGGDFTLKGRLNAEGFVSDIFNNIKLQSEIDVNDLFVNDYEIGDVLLNQFYQPEDSIVLVVGNIQNEKTKTLGIKGSYDLRKDDDNLDLALVFNNTDISFVNAFVPEDVISNVRGILKGELKIKGSVTEPELDGEINFMAGNVKVEMLGANFGFDGKIKLAKNLIAMDYIPVFDEEGNMGHLNASIFHNKFTDFNYDLNLDLDRGVDKFLVLNTTYKPGDAFYGTAYVKGIVGVSGYKDLTYIDADITPKKGSVINLPMAGITELEEDDFITFVSNDSINIDTTEKVNAMEGIVMNFNAHANSDALFRLIFDESTGDVIQGRAEGDITMEIDRFGELKMYGGAKIVEGDYQFTMTNLFSKKFEVIPGGTISWTGSPYDASLDLTAIYKLTAPMYDLMLGTVSEDELATYKRPEAVRCEIDIDQTLSDMKLSFDFSAPNSTETVKAVIEKTKNDEDEKNKQFFSLLLLNKFIPPAGSQGTNAGVSAGAAATADFVSNQLSSILSQLSDDYDIGVKYATDNFTDNSEFEVGVSTQLLNDRLKISGSFGVANSTSGESSTNNIIGDVALDYNINEKGTFVLSVFNESNEFDVTNNIAGKYTQGVSVSYREEFENFHDFILIQYILDIFRPEEKDRVPDGEIEIPAEGKEEEFIYKNFIKNR